MKKKIKIFISKYKIELFTMFMLMGSVYYVLMQIGISTPDELISIAKAQIEGVNFRIQSRWGWCLYTIPLYLQQKAGCYMIYRLYTLAGLIIACTGIVNIIYHHFDKKFAWTFPILFFLFATINLEHNGLYSFGWNYQFSIGLFFISIDLFLFYLKKGKSGYLVFSCIFYFFSMAAYEIFVPLGIIFFFLSYYYWYDCKSLTWKKLVADLKWHTIIAVSYTVSFFMIGNIYFNGNTGDAQISGGVNFVERIHTCWDFSLSLFPLYIHNVQGNLSELFRKAFELTGSNMLQWGIIFFFSAIFTWLITSVKKKITVRMYAFITVVCFLGMLIPNALLVLNSKFVIWHRQGIWSFGTAYYSYFFIIFWIEITFAIFYQVSKFKNFAFCITVTTVTMISELVMVGNQGTISTLNEQENRYETFAEFIQTDEYADTDKDAVIYTENLLGIYQDITLDGYYADGIAGTKTTWTDEKENIDFSHPVYMLKYDANAKAIYYAKIDSMWKTDRVYVYQHEPEVYGIKVKRISGRSIAGMIVNGTYYGHYGSNVITASVEEKLAETSVECEAMDMRSFSILHKTSGIDTNIVQLSGFYENEEWGRWVQKESRIEIDNLYGADKCVLKFSLLAHDVAKIHISNDKYSKDIDVDTELRNFEMEIPLKSGINLIKIDSDAVDLDIDTDLRNINWGTTYFNITLGDGVISLVN